MNLPLTSFLVRYNDGSHLITNMAYGVTLPQAFAYYTSHTVVSVTRLDELPPTTRTGFVKVTWTRDRSASAGQPSTGRFNCPCGQAPLSMFNPTQPPVICECGTVYRWDGWILETITP